MKEIEALRELETWLQEHKVHFNSLTLETKLRAVERARVSDKVYSQSTELSEEATKAWLNHVLENNP